LLWIIILLVLLAVVVRNLVEMSGSLGENLFLLAVVVAGLFIGIGFLIRLFRSADGDKKEPLL
jgi:hypothetical protein